MSSVKYTPPSGKSDVIFQEIKLFIEGVQVPFLSISISTALNQLPTASINIPPQVGLMEIARFYNPKVHIFYTDPVDGVEKVLFMGIITGTSFSKSADGNAMITFNVVHRFNLIGDYVLDFTGWLGEVAATFGVQKTAQVSSEFAIGMAMTGIFRTSDLIGTKVEVNKENSRLAKEPGGPDVSSAILPESLKDYAHRFVGVPGILLNLWNQFKDFAYRENEENEVSNRIYFPLIEDGLQFFKRLGGHYYIEDLIEEDRIDPCPDDKSTKNTTERIVPPMTRVFLRSAVQTDMSVKLAQQVLQFSGEISDVLTIFQKLVLILDYEIVYLSSPAEVPLNSKTDGNANFQNSSETYALETIVKPQLPFYYSPVCNVLYPNMIRNISITQDEYSIPTRIEAKNPEMVRDSDITNTYFRGPTSIREAIARAAGERTKTTVLAGSDITPDEPQSGTTKTTNTTDTKSIYGSLNADLRATLGPGHNKVGKYEQSRGIKFDKILTPKWLSYYSSSQFDDAGNDEGWPTESTDKANFDALKRLDAGWKARYGDTKDNLNPWSKDSGLKAYQRLLIANADYEYSKRVTRARVGSVDCIFNPYIVPGYPMDILDGTPNHPSFHAYCSSVTHSITASSISTSVSFVAAVTYTELANYYMMPVHPWLLDTFRLSETQSLIRTDGRNAEAELIADKFYTSTLGVKSVAPSTLYNFETGGMNPLARPTTMMGVVPGSADEQPTRYGTEANPMLTASGNLTLVRRPIETRDAVEERWNIKFIEMTPQNYTTNAIRYANKIQSSSEALEPGQSQWVKYEPLFEEPTLRPAYSINPRERS
jgi:hypothetical protein